MEAMAVERPAMQTASGLYVDMLEPEPHKILISDIAAHLSRLTRFVGATKFYSVAEHSLIVARILADDGQDEAMQLAGLLHDAHEAYIGDIGYPLSCALKVMIPHFSLRPIKERWDRTIGDGLNLPGIMERCALTEIHDADVRALATERYHLLLEQHRPWPITAGVERPAITPLGLAPEIAEQQFLQHYTDLRLRVRI